MSFYLCLHGSDFIVVGCDFLVELKVFSVGGVGMAVGCFELLLNLLELVLQF